MSASQFPPPPGEEIARVLQHLVTVAHAMRATGRRELKAPAANPAGRVHCEKVLAEFTTFCPMIDEANRELSLTRAMLTKALRPRRFRLFA